jgi:small subunit ribosomal protein S17
MITSNFVLQYFEKNVAYIAHDAENKCKSGDIVLIEEMSKQLTRDITHDILKVVYPLGDVTDPITGKKCEGGQYREDRERLDRLWGKNENAFDYEKAPARGWQEGKKDWSHKPAQRKFHEFTDKETTEHEYI